MPLSITEAERYEMHQRLEEVLGPVQASRLMEQLPPVGWADVATKQDLARLEQSLRAEMTHLGAEMAHLGDRIENRLLRDQRTYLFAMLSAFMALLAVTLTITQLG